MNNSSAKKLLKCDICHQTFNNKANSFRHTWHMHEKNIETLQCEVCTSTFTTLPDLLGHTKKVHENVALKFCCDICEQDTFTRIDRLKRHMLTH